MSEPFQLFQRAGSSKWWVRFSIRGQGQIRKSLDTTDGAEANQRARKVYYEALYRTENGLNATVKTFGDMAEEFIAKIEREVERGERKKEQGEKFPGIIRRYMVGYFGDRAMDSITDRDIDAYTEWRKDYWTKGPGRDIAFITYERAGRQIRRPITKRDPPTLSRQRNEAVLLRTLLRFAAKQGYIKQAAIPEVEVVKAPDVPRPSFSADEFGRLVETSMARMSDPKLNEHVRRDRAILHAYMMIAAFTGCRPTELKGMNWGDVLGYREGRNKPLRDRDIRLRVRGKGKARTFVPQEAALPWFDTLWMLWVRAMKRDPLDTEPVFATTAGNRLDSVKKSLAELLKACNLLTDHRGVRRTSYSFRHFYISQQLIAGVDIFILARNTGTSSDMIHRFYADVKLELMKDHLRPEWKLMVSV
ncbi:tyrosine-type recombinase/integrase [Azospirillum palustre]